MTNARSLSPKIASLHTAFDEHKLDFAIITESWLKDGSVLERDVIDLEYGTRLKILYKNRPSKRASNRAVGGGVAIVFSKASSNFRERKIVGNGRNFELLVATGRINKCTRPVAIICLYIPPRTKVSELDELRTLLEDQILMLKTSLNNPIIFVGGDVNRRDLDLAFSNYNDIHKMNSNPTSPV